MNMLEIQILAPNLYKDPIGAMDMNTCSAWCEPDVYMGHIRWSAVAFMGR